MLYNIRYTVGSIDILAYYFELNLSRTMIRITKLNTKKREARARITA